MADLAISADVVARLGRPLTAAETARIAALLADASAAVRGYTGQDFTQATTTLTTPVRRGIVVLPQRPVTAVSAVTNIDNAAVYFRWNGIDRVTLNVSSADSFEWEPYRFGVPRVVKITYTHGYATIPPDIVGVACSIVTRSLGRRPEDSAVMQESIAGYSYSTGAAGAAGGFGMLPDERAVLDRYRRVGGWVDVTRAS